MLEKRAGKGGQSALDIIRSVCDEMNSANSLVHEPRIVKRDDFDLTGYSGQESGFDGVDTEWVRQSGPGYCDDDYSGTLVVPIDADHFFVVDYAT